MNLATNMNQVADELASMKNTIELIWKDLGTSSVPNVEEYEEIIDRLWIGQADRIEEELRLNFFSSNSKEAVRLIG